MTLTSGMKKLLLMSGCAMVIFMYIGIFVNLYIWERNHDLFDIAWYHLWMFLAAALAYTGATKGLFRYSIRSIIRISVYAGATAFLLLSLYHPENALLGIVVYAVPIGIMMGAYWGGMNIMLAVFGKGKEFEVFFAVLAVISQVIAISVPMLSALVIDLTGYVGSFLLMILFVLLMYIVSFSLPEFSMQQEGDSFKSDVGSPLRERSFTSIRFSLKISFFHGVLMTFQNVFVLLFTFQVTENEWLIALLNVIYTLSSIVALIWFKQKRYIHSRNWLLIGVVLTSIGFGCALIQTPLWLIASNICTTVGLFYINTIVFSWQLVAIENESPSRKATFLLWREWVFLLSRCIIIGTIVFVEETGYVFYLLLLFVIFSSFMIPYLFSNKSLASPVQKTKYQSL